MQTHKMSTRIDYDDWSPSRPSSEWPGRREISSSERPRVDQQVAAVPVVPTATSLQVEARREPPSLVRVPSTSRDDLDSPDQLQPVDGLLTAPADTCRREHQRV